MRVKTTYVSILGREYETPEEARADEDRLPSIIATYTRDLQRIQNGEMFAGKPGPHPQHLIDTFAESLADYEAKWVEVQAQREQDRISQLRADHGICS